jgi:hypothetical protein
MQDSHEKKSSGEGVNVANQTQPARALAAEQEIAAIQRRVELQRMRLLSQSPRNWPGQSGATNAGR